MERPLTPGDAPEVLRGAAAQWPAAQWSFASLRQRAGDQTLPVHTGRWKSKGWRVAREGKTRMMRVADYVDALEAGEPCGYLAGNELFTAVPSLRDELRFPDVGSFAVDVVWVGPQGAFTPVHFDRSPNVYAQLVGTKRWRVWRPERPLKPVFAGPGYAFSALDIDAGPEGAGPPDLDVELNAGDVLLLPKGWWHRVDTLSPSIAVNRWWALESVGRAVRRVAQALRPQK